MIPVSPQELALLVQRYGSPQRFQDGGDGQYMSEDVVSGAPRQWQSSPDHPLAHLAYITDAEAELLKQADLHDSGIAEEEHFGPEGIPSYQGDGGGGDGGGGDGGGEGGPGNTGTEGMGVVGGPPSGDTFGDEGIGPVSTGVGPQGVSDPGSSDTFGSEGIGPVATGVGPQGVSDPATFGAEDAVTVGPQDAEEGVNQTAINTINSVFGGLMSMPIGLMTMIGNKAADVLGLTVTAPPTAPSNSAGTSDSGLTSSGVPSAVPGGLSDSDTATADPSPTMWERSQTGYEPGVRYGMQGGQRFFEDPEIRPVTAARGGLANLQSSVRKVASQGRGRDRTLMHITPREAQNFRKMGAPVNPKTGLLEADWWDDIIEWGVNLFSDSGGSPETYDFGGGGLDAVTDTATTAAGSPESYDFGGGGGYSSPSPEITTDPWEMGVAESASQNAALAQARAAMGGGGEWQDIPGTNYMTNGKMVVPKAAPEPKFSWEKLATNPLTYMTGFSMLGSYNQNKKAQQQQKTTDQQKIARQALIDNPGGQKYAMDRVMQPFTGDMRKYGLASSDKPGGYRWWDKSDASPVRAARGGLSGLGPKSPDMGMRPSNLMAGPGGGQDDKIPALLSPGEYVFDADATAALGDGNPEEGARKLDQMREKIRKHKRAASPKKIPPKAKPAESYLKGGA